MKYKLIKTTDYILVVDDSEIKEGDWYKTPLGIYSQFNGTEKLLEGTKKVSAHLPLNGLPILEGVPLLPPYSRHQEDGLDYAVMSFKESWVNLGVTDYELSAFSEGYNKAREKYKYTEEDMRKALLIKHDGLDADYVIEVISNKYPTEFECEMIPCNPIKYTTEDHLDVEPKTITTAQGVQWVGKYK